MQPSAGSQSGEIRRAGPRAALLVTLYFVLVGVQSLYVSDTPMMSVLYDEYLYDEMAVEIGSGQLPTMNQVNSPRYPPLYSVVLAPVARLFGNDRFGPARLLNVFLYTLTFFAVYLIARRFVSPAGSLVAAVASVIGPSLISTSLFLSENIYFPLFAFYLLTIIRLLEAPSYSRSVAAAVLAAACFATKLVAILPIGLIGLFLLFLMPGSRPSRLKHLGLHALVFGVLVLPWAVTVLPELLAAYVRETDTSATAGPAKYAVTLLNHLLAPLMSMGPLAVALALAHGIRGLRSGDPLKRRFALLFALVIATTFVVSAVWIAAARPLELRVEERYQLPIYPLILILAVAAIESRSRGWIPWYVAVIAVFLVTPTYQLDPDRALFWLHVNPSPLALQLLARKLGWTATATRIGFVAAWSAIAVAYLLLPRMRGRRLMWAAVLAPGFAYLWLIGGPIFALKHQEAVSGSQALAKIQRLLDRHQAPGDRLVFAGVMAQPVPYAVAATRRIPYWHQVGLDSLTWVPGVLDEKTGRFTARTLPAERWLLLASDGVTRGGKLIDEIPPWCLYLLDPSDPRLHSFLILESRPASEEPRQVFNIYLWPMPDDRRRDVEATPRPGTGPKVKFIRYAPYLHTDWMPLDKPTTAPIPPLENVPVTKMRLEVIEGWIRVGIEEKPR